MIKYSKLKREKITKKYTKIYRQKFCHELLNRYDSIHCGYAIINCIRDNIETNRCPVDTLNKCHNKLGIIKYCISVTINTI